MSLFFMTATAEQGATQREAPKEAPRSVLARLVRPREAQAISAALAQIQGAAKC